ncbi:hypothetical protein F7725_023347 [Dissostichus mawsoni]|uniref:Uncharacterized protein n=1 Tax=Dissostichus mawsoni TaxID=36200 RepID=A0A7J5Z0F4_DISMA|nr:hypothetical protein F7725_023347 [Dissostichus mawsoni]
MSSRPPPRRSLMTESCERRAPRLRTPLHLKRCWRGDQAEGGRAGRRAGGRAMSVAQVAVAAPDPVPGAVLIQNEHLPGAEPTLETHTNTEEHMLLGLNWTWHISPLQAF